MDDEGMVEDEADGDSGAEKAPDDAVEPMSIASVARFVVARKATRGADGTWVFVDAGEQEDAVIVHTTEEDAMSVSSFASRPNGDEWPCLPNAGSRMAAVEEWADFEEVDLVRTGDECADGSDLSEWDDLDGESASPRPVEGMHEHEVAQPHEAVNLPKVASRAWQGAAATRAAIGAEAAAAGGMAQFAAAVPRTRLPLSAAIVKCGSERGTIQMTEKWMKTISGDDLQTLEEAAMAPMDTDAGVKDSAHRRHGSRGLSVKLVEKRTASIAKRAACRSGT